MPRLQIDNREVEVPAGATVLDAARRLGLDIPTLCFLEGYKPSTSCQVCLVKVVDSGRFVPSCATVAVDGMRIESETPAVHELRRTALELLLSDHVGDCLAPCYFACPAHMDIPQMLRDIGTEDVPSAIATIKQDIALPAILGRVCPKPCEKGCRRSSGDGPVEVCDLKRYVADLDLASPQPYQPPCQPATGKRVAVIGAGPTGLAAAFYLRRAGHAVTLYDDQPQPGGRLWREFPEAQLPRATLVAEVNAVLAAGIELRPATRVGQDVPLSQLQEQFDAVLVACGHISRPEAQRLGLPAGTRGIEANHSTFETPVRGLFAAGNAMRGKGLVVRSVADGKEAAAAIDQYLRVRPVAPVHRPFSSRIHKLTDEELPEFLALASPGPRRDGEITEAAAVSLVAAAHQADRCLSCGCPAHGHCRLERYAALYGADPSKYHSGRRAFVRVNRHGAVIYEPGKCINCALCIQIAAQSQTALGLSFVGRGFDVRVGVPFHGTLEQGLGDVAAQCVAACPTGALYFSPAPQLVALTPRSGGQNPGRASSGERGSDTKRKFSAK